MKFLQRCGLADISLDCGADDDLPVASVHVPSVSTWIGCASMGRRVKRTWIDHEVLVGERKHVTVLCADVEVS
jgi:hypothetical protein